MAHVSRSGRLIEDVTPAAASPDASSPTDMTFTKAQMPRLQSEPGAAPATASAAKPGLRKGFLDARRSVKAPEGILKRTANDVHAPPAEPDSAAGSRVSEKLRNQTEPTPVRWGRQRVRRSRQ